MEAWKSGKKTILQDHRRFGKDTINNDGKRLMEMFGLTNVRVISSCSSRVKVQE